MGVHPSGTGRLTIPGVRAEQAVVLQAVNTAYDRNNDVATFERIRNALLMKGERQLTPLLRTHLLLLAARGKLEALDELGLQWRPV